MNDEQFSVESDDAYVFLFCVACGLDLANSKDGFMLDELVRQADAHNCPEMSDHA